MAADSTHERQAAKRAWVVLLYFYLAALVGLGFVIVGITMALFGAKIALFPGLGLPAYTYDYQFHDEAGRFTEPSEEELQAARGRAIDERRSSGLDDMISGLIVAGVGTPVLIWHYRRGRALGTEKPGTPAPE